VLNVIQWLIIKQLHHYCVPTKNDSERRQYVTAYGSKNILLHNYVYLLLVIYFSIGNMVAWTNFCQKLIVSKYYIIILFHNILLLVLHWIIAQMPIST